MYLPNFIKSAETLCEVYSKDIELNVVDEYLYLKDVWKV